MSKNSKENDLISRQEAIDALGEEPLVWNNDDDYEIACRNQWRYDVAAIKAVQPKTHNITMMEVLQYLDRMPEDVWQEFTSCLEIRGWSLKRNTAKWCGSNFA